MLVCSSVRPTPWTTPTCRRAAAPLADRAGERGLRIAYEALAWGRHVSTWDAAWDAVRRADSPALGLCLDSFHVLSRDGDPAGLAAVPGEKIFFLQLADAPHMDMDVLQWSRHHRLFPGQGAFDLTGVHRGTCWPPVTPARCRSRSSTTCSARPTRRAPPWTRMRSLLALEERLGVRCPDLAPTSAPPAPALTGHAFTELAVDGVSGPEVAGALAALGFAHTGQHRSKPVQLWEQGEARVLLNASVVAPVRRPGSPRSAAIALESADPGRVRRRGPRRSGPRSSPAPAAPPRPTCSAVAAPDGTAVFFARTGPDGLAGRLPADRRSAAARRRASPPSTTWR